MVRDMRNRFWICLFFTVPIFVYAPMGGMWQPPAPPFGLELDLWLFLLASAAIIYPSWPFFVSAWRGLKKGILGMAALIVLSVGTGYIFSVASTFFFDGGGQFFEAAAVLPLLSSRTVDGRRWCRLSFSLSEVDETHRPGAPLRDFRLELAAGDSGP